MKLKYQRVLEYRWYVSSCYFQKRDFITCPLIFQLRHKGRQIPLDNLCMHFDNYESYLNY